MAGADRHEGGFPVVLGATFVVAQLADALTALVVSRELNPIIGATPPAVSIVLKLVLICFVLAVVQLIDHGDLFWRGWFSSSAWSPE